jgi:hypothetical protein
MTRAHMQKGRGSRRRGKQHQERQATNWAGKGLGRSAQAGRPGHFRGPIGLPFDLIAYRVIYSPLPESHAGIKSSSTAEKPRSLRDTISEMRVVLVV